MAAGDSLSGIAARNGTSVGALARANGISDPNVIVAGRRLVLPDDGPGSSDGGAAYALRRRAGAAPRRAPGRHPRRDRLAQRPERLGAGGAQRHLQPQPDQRRHRAVAARARLPGATANVAYSPPRVGRVGDAPRAPRRALRRPGGARAGHRLAGEPLEPERPLARRRHRRHAADAGHRPLVRPGGARSYGRSVQPQRQHRDRGRLPRLAAAQRGQTPAPRSAATTRGWRRSGSAVRTRTPPPTSTACCRYLGRV